MRPGLINTGSFDMANKFHVGYRFKEGSLKYVITDRLVTRNSKNRVVGIKYVCDCQIGRRRICGVVKTEAALVAVNEEMKTEGSR